MKAQISLCISIVSLEIHCLHILTMEVVVRVIRIGVVGWKIFFIFVIKNLHGNDRETIRQNCKIL